MAWYETGAIELFKLDEDISESMDVAERYSEDYVDLRVRLRDYLKRVDAQMPTLDWTSFGLDAESEDVDQDGLPDAWEFRELLTWTSGADDDPDKDGKNNLAEFNAGSDPLIQN